MPDQFASPSVGPALQAVGTDTLPAIQEPQVPAGVPQLLGLAAQGNKQLQGQLQEQAFEKGKQDVLRLSSQQNMTTEVGRRRFAAAVKNGSKELGENPVVRQAVINQNYQLLAEATMRDFVTHYQTSDLKGASPDVVAEQALAYSNKRLEGEGFDPDDPAIVSAYNVSLDQKLRNFLPMAANIHVETNGSNYKRNIGVQAGSSYGDLFGSYNSTNEAGKRGEASKEFGRQTMQSVNTSIANGVNPAEALITAATGISNQVELSGMQGYNIEELYAGDVRYTDAKGRVDTEAALTDYYDNLRDSFGASYGELLTKDGTAYIKTSKGKALYTDRMNQIDVQERHARAAAAQQNTARNLAEQQTVGSAAMQMVAEGKVQDAYAMITQATIDGTISTSDGARVMNNVMSLHNGALELNKKSVDPTVLYDLRKSIRNNPSFATVTNALEMVSSRSDKQAILDSWSKANEKGCNYAMDLADTAKSTSLSVLKRRYSDKGGQYPEVVQTAFNEVYHRYMDPYLNNGLECFDEKQSANWRFHMGQAHKEALNAAEKAVEETMSREIGDSGEMTPGQGAELGRNIFRRDVEAQQQKRLDEKAEADKYIQRAQAEIDAMNEGRLEEYQAERMAEYEKMTKTKKDERGIEGMADEADTAQVLNDPAVLGRTIRELGDTGGFWDIAAGTAKLGELIPRALESTVTSRITEDGMEFGDSPSTMLTPSELRTNLSRNVGNSIAATMQSLPEEFFPGVSNATLGMEMVSSIKTAINDPDVRGLLSGAEPGNYAMFDGTPGQWSGGYYFPSEDMNKAFESLGMEPGPKTIEELLQLPARLQL